MLPDPNSAPDSLTPSHCRTPDVDVLSAAAAALDEALGTETVEEAIILLEDIANGIIVDAEVGTRTVEEVVLVLEGVAKSSTVKEEGGAGRAEEVFISLEGVSEDTMIEEDVGTVMVVDKAVLLECVCVDPCFSVGASGSCVSKRYEKRSILGSSPGELPNPSNSHSSSSGCLATGAESAKADKPAASKEVEKRMALEKECD
jgi:hypothetical protein